MIMLYLFIGFLVWLFAFEDKSNAIYFVVCLFFWYGIMLNDIWLSFLERKGTDKEE